MNEEVEQRLDSEYSMRIVRDEQFYRTFYRGMPGDTATEGKKKSASSSPEAEDASENNDASEEEEEEEEILPDGSVKKLKAQVPYGVSLRFECQNDYRDGLQRHNQVLTCEKDGSWSRFNPLACVHSTSCLFSDLRDPQLGTYSGTYYHPRGRPFKVAKTMYNGRNKNVDYLEHGQWVAPACSDPDFVRADTRKRTQQKDLSSVERLYCYDGNWEMVKDVEGFVGWMKDNGYAENKPPKPKEDKEKAEGEKNDDEDGEDDDDGKGSSSSSADGREKFYANIPDAERAEWTNQAPLGGCRRLLSCEEEKWLKVMGAPESSSKDAKKPPR
ncbi:unnamed protein product, partial [Amoebophrya sp. A25]|eukprot:GSA25T00016692001.1